MQGAGSGEKIAGSWDCACVRGERLVPLSEYAST